MIHISEIHKIVEHGEFSLQFIATTGEVVEGKRCVCTSFHSDGRTMNIKFCDSGQIRKVRRCTLIAINDKEVAL